MAGYMYLGSNKVCPAIVVGGGEQAVMPLFDLVDGELAWKSVITASGITKLTKAPLYYNTTNSIFRGRSEIEEIYFPDVEIIDEDCEYLLAMCPNLEVVSFSNVKEIKTGGLLDGCIECPKLTTIDFSSLETVRERGLAVCFLDCPISGSISFQKLEYIGSSGLAACFMGAQITECRFEKVDYLEGYALSMCFYKNTTLQNIYFNSLKSTSFAANNVFEDMLYGVTGCTVHFPSNLQSVIGSWSDVVGGFGGTNTTVLFDLPATS